MRALCAVCGGPETDHGIWNGYHDKHDYEPRANVMAPQAITRSADHRYSVCAVHFPDGVCPLNCTNPRITYPGVTSILKVLDKSDALMGWAARQTAEAAVSLSEADGVGGVSALDSLLMTAGREGAIRALTSRSSWQRDEAAQLGTEVHRLADIYINGDGSLPGAYAGDKPGVQARVEAYADWWSNAGWTLRLSEAMIVNPQWGYGGTFDLLALDADGRTVLADIKTGKGVYREAVLQLAAYGAFADTVVQFTDGKVYPMPKADRFVVLHVTTDGVREVELSVGAAEMSAFCACLDLHHWTESMKGKRL